MAEVTKQSREAGAIGAVVGESVADLMMKRTNDQKLISDVSSGLAAGTVAAYAGYDVVEELRKGDITVKQSDGSTVLLRNFSESQDISKARFTIEIQKPANSKAKALELKFQ